MEIVLEEYTKLTLNWVPLPLQMAPNDFEDEQDWLARKNHSKHVCSSSTAGIYHGIQPLACYLPHVDIYALPYVVPF